MNLEAVFWGGTGAALLLSSCCTVGFSVSHAGGLIKERPADGEDLLMALGVGTGILSVLFLLVGFFGILSRPVVIVIGSILTLFSVLYLAARGVLSISRPRRRGIHIIFVGAILILALFNLVSALAPPSDADSLRHHLAAPEWYASQKGFEFIPVLWWNLPSTQHVLYTILIILFNDRSVQLMSWVLGLLVCLALFFLSRRVLASDWCAGMATVIFYSVPLTTYLAGTAYVEFAVAFYALLSILALVRSGEESARLTTRWILLSGLLAGLAASSKLTGLLVLVAGAATLLLHGYFRKWRPSELIVNYSIFCGAALVVLSPWLLRNFFTAGDPLWPVLSSFFSNDYWQSWQIEKFAAWERGAGAGMPALLAGPWTLTTNISAYTAGSGILSPFLLPPLLLAFSPAAFLLSWNIHQKGRQALALTLLFAFVFYGLWWLGGYHHPRYLQSLHPVFALWSGVGIVLLWQESSQILPRFIIGVLVGSSLLVTTGINFAYNTRSIPVVMGAVSEQDYLEQNVSFFKSLEWANRNLPDDARILFLGLQGFYYLDRAYLPGMPAYQGLIQYSDFQEPEGLHQELVRRGLTHIYFEGINFAAAKNLEDAQARMPADLDFAARMEWRPVTLLAPLLETGELKEIYCEPDSMIRSRTFSRQETAWVAVYEVDRGL